MDDSTVRRFPRWQLEGRPCRAAPIVEIERPVGGPRGTVIVQFPDSSRYTCSFFADWFAVKPDLTVGDYLVGRPSAFPRTWEVWPAAVFVSDARRLEDEHAAEPM